MIESETRSPAFAVIKVAALGFDERSRQALAQVLKHHTGSGIRLADYQEAAVVLLDMDGKDTDQLWEQYRQTPNRLPAVVVAKQPCHEGQAAFVKKPLSVLELVDAITAAAQGAQASADSPSGTASPNVAAIRQRAISLELRKQDNSARPQVRKRRPSSGAAVSFKPHDFVLGGLLEGLAQARRAKRALHIRCWGSRNIVLDPARNEAHTDLTEKQLHDLGFISVHCNNGPAAVSTLLTNKRLAQLLKNSEHTLSTLPLDAFVWKLSLYTSRGRVPEGTDLTQPVYLRHWPNLTRLEPIPEASRIVALWVRQPRSLLRLYGSLMAPLEHILDLYTAASALGLAGVARRSADTLFEPEEPQSHTQHGLLASVVRKLGGGRLLGKHTKADPPASPARKSAS